MPGSEIGSASRRKEGATHRGIQVSATGERACEKDKGFRSRQQVRRTLKLQRMDTGDRCTCE